MAGGARERGVRRRRLPLRRPRSALWGITYNLRIVVPYTPPAYTYGGHVVSKSPTRVELGWKDGPGVHYVLTKTFGYKMSVNGSPHMGFTGAPPATGRAWPRTTRMTSS